jgi:hypothetical protein
MARTSETITQPEVHAYQTWCRANLVVWSDNKHNPTSVQASNSNATLIADYFQNQWKMDLTKINLEAALTVLRPRLVFFESVVQQQWDNVAAQLSNHQYQVLESWFMSQPILVTDGDQGKTNLIVMLDVLQKHGKDISVENLNLMLSNGYFTLNNGPKQQARTVYFKKILQPYEVENLRRKQEADAPPTVISISGIDKQAERDEQARRQRQYERNLRGIA